ncbi:MAG: thioredoxin family protein [Thioalkalivibrio sp.]
MSPLAIFFVCLIAAYFGFQFWLLYRTRNQQGRPAPDLSDLLDADTLARPRLVFYFWSPACPMCGQVTRVIDPLLESREDIIKINAMEQPELARRFRVMGTPTLLVVSNGYILRVLVGAKSEKAILELVG